MTTVCLQYVNNLCKGARNQLLLMRQALKLAFSLMRLQLCSIQELWDLLNLILLQKHVQLSLRSYFGLHSAYYNSTSRLGSDHAMPYRVLGSLEVPCMKPFFSPYPQRFFSLLRIA